MSSASCQGEAADHFAKTASNTLAKLKDIQDNTVTTIGSSGVIMPTSREELANAIHGYPAAPLVAGSTDFGLSITQQLKNVEKVISLSAMDSLKKCTKTEQSLIIGAGAPLNDIASPLLSAFPQLAELITRFASLPIRNQATLGGNIANASPIGDMPPALLALGASLHLDNGQQVRVIPLKGFFTGYRQTQLEKGEWISAIEIPLLSKDNNVAAYKISKRMEDDISAVCAVFNLTLVDGVVTSLQTGFGGVAATPETCPTLEGALIGKQWKSADCLHLGKQMLKDAFNPIDDVRASAAYRNQVLSNLWHRFWLENQAQNTIETRVVQHA